MRGILFSALSIFVVVSSASQQCMDPPFGYWPSLFNTWTLGDFHLLPIPGKNTGSDVEGRLAVGGNSVIYNSIGQNIPDVPCYQLVQQGIYENVLVVRGKLTFANEGGIKGGNIVVGDPTSIIPLYPQQGFVGISKNCSVFYNASAIDFNTEHDKLHVLSKHLATLPPTGTARWTPAGLSFQGTGAEIEVFKVPDGQMFLDSRVPRLTGISRNVKSIIFNIGGLKSGFFRMNMDDFVTRRRKILFNFYNATTVVSQYTGVQGSILAPSASMFETEGVIWGQMFVYSHSGNMQQNQPPFDGCIPPPPVNNCTEACPGVGCRSNEPSCDDISTGNPCTYYVCNAIFAKRTDLHHLAVRQSSGVPSECVEVGRVFGTVCNWTDTGCVLGRCNFLGFCIPTQNNCTGQQSTTTRTASPSVAATPSSAPTTVAATTSAATTLAATGAASTAPAQTQAPNGGGSYCTQYYLDPIDFRLKCINSNNKRSALPDSVAMDLPVNPTTSEDFVPTDGSLVAAFTLDHLTGVYDERLAATKIDVYGNSGPITGQAYQVRLSYDWTADGHWDRYEVWGIFELDNDAGSWQNYRDTYSVPFFVSGDDYQEFKEGTLRIEFWQVYFNGGAVQVLAGGPSGDGSYSRVVIPYSAAALTSSESSGTSEAGMATWAIIVVVLVSVAALALVALLVYKVFLGSRKQSQPKLTFRDESPQQEEVDAKKQVEMEEQRAVEELKQQRTKRDGQDKEASEEMPTEESVDFQPNSKSVVVNN